MIKSQKGKISTLSELIHPSKKTPSPGKNQGEQKTFQESYPQLIHLFFTFWSEKIKIFLRIKKKTSSRKGDHPYTHNILKSRDHLLCFQKPCPQKTYYDTLISAAMATHTPCRKDL
jgi:hypothetical protein